MSEVQKQIEQLAARISQMNHEQNRLTSALSQMEKQLDDLKLSLQIVKSFEETQPVTERKVEPSNPLIAQPEAPYTSPVQPQATLPKRNYNSRQMEDFIGTNLISKIGILITVVGIFIGAKYAMDKELISTAMRIALGYTAGAALVITALKLKVKYEKFSAVLMGGGLAVLYFITYIGFDFYKLFPQLLAFLLMLLVTIATVSVSLWYNQKVIAIIGQVGAYAIPFLLSDGSGRVVVLFSYISIINVGLLVLSFYKDWKVLYRIGFILTWLIYVAWVVESYKEVRPFSLGMVFLCINFLTFYATFLCYKVIKKEQYHVGEVMILLANALLFFFLGASLTSDSYAGNHALSVFTLANAAVHLIVAFTVYQLQLADRSVFQFLAGLGLLFVTISIPIELDGSWVTLLWALEATALCIVAFKNNRQLYLALAVPMIIVAVFSLMQDWIRFYPHLHPNYTSEKIDYQQPFLHLNFLFFFIVCSCFGYISWLSFQTFPGTGLLMRRFFHALLPFIFVFVLYFTLFSEIHYAWDQIIASPASVAGYYGVENIVIFRQVNLIIFSLFFVVMLLLVNKVWVKSNYVGQVLGVFGILCVFFFVTMGLNLLGTLRQNYLSLQLRGLSPTVWMLSIRYVCITLLALLFFVALRSITNMTVGEGKLFSLLFNATLLTVICNEFVHWMDVSGYQNQYKLGLSLIWGVYALALIFAGIKYRKKHLRLASIVLFSATLYKLFFYDLSSLPTISKTIVLVILGIILLLVSFLYTKYKHIILGDDELGK